MGRKAVSVDMKKKIITLREVGMSKHKISKHCGISRNGVIQTIRKYDEKQYVSTTPGGGRKPKLTERQKRAIKIEQLRNDTMSLNDLVKFVQINFGVTVGRSTISRILNDFGLLSYIAPKKPAINKQQRQKRVRWCKEHIEWPMDSWTRIIFSDESRFELLNRNNRVYIRRYRHDSQRHKRSQPRSHKGGGLGVFGCLTYYGLSDLFFYDGNIDSFAYIGILEHTLPSALSQFPAVDRRRATLQHDNARVHVSAKTQNYLRNKKVSVLSWPSNSPDINIIENIWSIIDNKLLKCTIHNMEELKNAIIEIWTEISLDTIHKLYSSIPKRLKQIIERQGYAYS